MVEILHIDAINRLIDEELAKAKAKYGPRHFDIIVLEGSRGDTMDDMAVLRGLRYLNRTGSRFKAILKRALVPINAANMLAGIERGEVVGLRLPADQCPLPWEFHPVPLASGKRWPPLMVRNRFVAAELDRDLTRHQQLLRACVMSLYCDRCLTPFSQADCWPDITPPGEDWSEFCPSCRERKLKFHLEAGADRAFHELAPVIYRPRRVANS